MCERWVEDWTNCNILTPSSFVFSSTSFSFCWAAQSGVVRVHSPLLGAGSHYSILSPTNWPQLTRTVCRAGLYHCFLTPTCFLWASHLHPIQPVHNQGYTLVSSTGCTCFSINGWDEGQYVTNLHMCWMKITFKYSCVFNWLLYNLYYREPLVLRSLYRIYMFNIGRMCFELSVTVLVGHIFIYMFICQLKSVKSAVLRFSLMLKPFGVKILEMLHSFIFSYFYYRHDIVQEMFLFLIFLLDFLITFSVIYNTGE